MNFLVVSFFFGYLLRQKPWISTGTRGNPRDVMDNAVSGMNLFQLRWQTSNREEKAGRSKEFLQSLEKLLHPRFGRRTNPRRD